MCVWYTYRNFDAIFQIYFANILNICGILLLHRTIASVFCMNPCEKLALMVVYLNRLALLRLKRAQNQAFWLGRINGESSIFYLVAVGVRAKCRFCIFSNLFQHE